MNLGLIKCSAASVAIALLGWNAGSSTVTSSRSIAPVIQESPDCEPECTCLLLSSVNLTSLPACVAGVNVTVNPSNDGCCSWPEVCTNPQNCTGTVIITITGAGPSPGCRVKIEGAGTPPNTSSGGVFGGSHPVVHSEGFSKGCIDHQDYPIFAGTPYTQFGTVVVECQSCF